MAEKKIKEVSQENAAPIAASPLIKEQSRRKLDETRPGGYYIVGGRVVNAEGKRIEED